MWPSEHEDRAVQRPLAPGRITPDVVRIGDTVRRPSSPQSRFVARLLTYLHARGFTQCPRHLGWDALGREVLSFIPGDVPARWQRLTDEQVARAASMLRRMHDASRGFPRDDNDYSRELSGDLGDHTDADIVVCHNDPGPTTSCSGTDSRSPLSISISRLPGTHLTMSATWLGHGAFRRVPTEVQSRSRRIRYDF